MRKNMLQLMSGNFAEKLSWFFSKGKRFSIWRRIIINMFYRIMKKNAIELKMIFSVIV
jgi:hypothetical protein